MNEKEVVEMLHGIKLVVIWAEHQGFRDTEGYTGLIDDLINERKARADDDF